MTEQPTEPQPEKQNVLPANCLFSDGKSRVDYVIIYPIIGDKSRDDQIQQKVNAFIAILKEKGLLIETEPGRHFTKLIFLKIHAPHKVLVRFAKIFNVDLTCNNPYYKYKETMFKFLTTELTRPNPNSDIYQRAPKTLEGLRPTELTTAERSLIVFKIVQQVSFFANNEELNFSVLTKRDIFLYAYPIHDGDYKWTKTGPLTDRQLLYRFWANILNVFKEQPVHLLEKYYGPKTAFYFAFQSCYTKMLMVPAIIGLMTVLAGLIQLVLEVAYIDKEVCESDAVLCSDQHMKSACSLMKLAYLIDNPMTIAYVIVCSFWGTVFRNLWQRRQAMLRLRWNLIGVKADRTMRKEFKEGAYTRQSSITGMIEYYVPPSKKILYYAFSFLVVIAMMSIFIVVVVLIVHYRFWLRKLLNYDKTSDANVIELLSSAALTAAIIMILDSITPLLMCVYERIAVFLTRFQMPRTQSQYDKMMLHKTFLLHFANHFMPHFYLAFFKGFFYTHPGGASSVSLLRSVQMDLCKPSGCLVDLGMQLFALLTVRTVVKSGFGFFRYWTIPWHTSQVSDEVYASMGQWERDFFLQDFNEGTVNEMYMELVIQYCFVTFFNAALPVIGLIAVLINLLKSQMDAFRFVRLYRRPIVQKVPDIGGWNEILKVVTVLGAISNSFVIAFRSDFVLRLWYTTQHGSLKGFVNSTLSKFSIKDYSQDEVQDIKNHTFCFYRGFRHPPDHPDKYQPTENFWQILAIRGAYFIILENVTLVLSLLLGFIIPEIPRKVKVKVEYDQQLLKEAREAKLESEIK